MVEGLRFRPGVEYTVEPSSHQVGVLASKKLLLQAKMRKQGFFIGT